jgi:hypothetical protein
MEENTNHFNTLSINGVLYKTGDKISCHIQGSFIETTAIYITKIKTSDSSVLCYICQNYYDGEKAPDRLGFKWSWAFYVHPLFQLRSSDVCGIKKLKLPDCFEYILVNAFPKILTYKELINGNRS